MKISDYLNDKKRLDFDVSSSAGDAKFWVDYKPNSLNYQTEEMLKGLTGFDRIATNVQLMLSDWDLTDDNDEKIPITVEAMKENGLPYNLLSTIIRGINLDLYGDKTDESKNE